MTVTYRVTASRDSLHHLRSELRLRSKLRRLAEGSAILSVAGGVTGSFVPLVVVRFGLGAVLMASAMLSLIVTVVGAAYLIDLGITTIRQRKKLAAALKSKIPSTGGGRVFRQGFIVGATNPKTIVFFGAVLPQFAVPTQGPCPRSC